MSKKGIIISIIIWLIFLGFELIEKYALNQIIYVQAEIFAIILTINIYKRGLTKYKNIEIKEIKASFLKTKTLKVASDSIEMNDNGKAIPSHYNKQTGYIYTYELNGKQYEYTSLIEPKDNGITLYYKKGHKDITSDFKQLNTFNSMSGTWRILLIVPGTAIIVYLILFYIFKIPANF